MIIRHDIPIAPYTYYRIGGIARDVYFPGTPEELASVLRRLADSGMPYYILGGGTNVLVGDGYWEGAVVITTGLYHGAPEEDTLTCGAGILSSRAAEIALERCRTGLEFLYLLPGTVGGALAGNARYDNISMSDVLVSTLAAHPEHGLRRFAPSDMVTAYKHTSIIAEGWIIAEMSLAWSPGNAVSIRARMEEIKRFRTEHHHFEFPSCGCIFKNDHTRNIRAGRLIDSLGLKGLNEGDARVADFHANFIVNTGHASACDVLALIERVERMVREQSGVELQREVKVVGNFG